MRGEVFERDKLVKLVRLLPGRGVELRHVADGRRPVLPARPCDHQRVRKDKEHDVAEWLQRVGRALDHLVLGDVSPRGRDEGRLQEKERKKSFFKDNS